MNISTGVGKKVLTSESDTYTLTTTACYSLQKDGHPQKLA